MYTWKGDSLRGPKLETVTISCLFRGSLPHINAILYFISGHNRTEDHNKIDDYGNAK